MTKRASNCSERLRTKCGQCVAAGNELVQVAHHLAAVADAQRESVAAREESRKLVARPGVEQDRFGPAFAGAQHVAIGKSAARGKALEVRQRHAAGDDVAHVHVERVEAGAIERRRHFDLAVDALLAQDRDARPRAVNKRRGDVRRRIKCQAGR